MFEDKIRLLYALQTVDIKLMELEEEKGDLPETVQKLTAQLKDLNERIDEIQIEINDHTTAREKCTLDAETHLERIEKLKSQLYKVRNNKEYDAITREINQAETSINRLLEDSDHHETKRKELNGTLEDLQRQRELVKDELQSTTGELREVSKVHETEELHLQHERDKVVRRLSADDLAHYDRIRSAKDGRAVVPIKRGACGGCYKTVSPQLNLLLRKNDEIYICENCGRILVAEEIAAEVNKVA